jgi:DNA-binding beta-propeller fold protein YncE
VLAADSGRQIATLFTGYEVDHVLLSPNGKEMWATSNGEGRIYVYDTASHKQLSVIQMPQNGDPHGLVWVHYDKDGNSKVVRDQGGFGGGVNPAAGTALDY